MLRFVIGYDIIGGMRKEYRTNAKRLGPEEQFLIRKSIIRLSKQGKKAKEVAEALDVSLRTVQAVKKAYDEKGFAGIKMKKRGRKKGEQRVLTPEQEKEIRGIIVDKNPEQMKLKGCMWTRKNIAELIKRKCGSDMGLSTLGYYLERWGFSVQRPITRAYKQQPKEVQGWLKVEYPAIKKRAEAEKAETYWGDETGVQNTADYLRGYAPVGKTPVIKTEAQKFKANLLSAITNKGKVRFMIYEQLSPDRMIDFMRRLIIETKRKIFLILDNLRIHHATKITEWLAKHKNEIEVFYLPPYMPEYNPDENLNSDLKRETGNRPMPHSAKDIEQNIRSYMKALQLHPDKIKSFFQSPTVKYAS